MTLYKVTNTVTGMAYIGATTQSIAKRMAEHRAKARDGWSHPFAAAIRTYGWSVFVVTVLGTFATHTELLAAERAAIAAAATMTPAGYNRASGGFGTPDCRHADETKRKIGARATGRKLGYPSPNRGRVMSPETRLKISQGLKGHATWNKGIKATEAHRAALRASHIGKVNPMARRVEFDGQEYPTIRAAAQALGLTKMQATYRLKMGRAKYL